MPHERNQISKLTPQQREDFFINKIGIEEWGKSMLAYKELIETYVKPFLKPSIEELHVRMPAGDGTTAAIRFLGLILALPEVKKITGVVVDFDQVQVDQAEGAIGEFIRDGLLMPKQLQVFMADATIPINLDQESVHLVLLENPRTPSTVSEHLVTSSIRVASQGAVVMATVADPFGMPYMQQYMHSHPSLTVVIDGEKVKTPPQTIGYSPEAIWVGIKQKRRESRRQLETK